MTDSTTSENGSPAACDECITTTSAAAYFVWLLDKLKQIEFHNGSSENKSNLQEKLLQRRPDLKGLELTCANTKNLIPYIDLVNEVLEDLVGHFHGNGSADSAKVSIHAYNMSDSDTSNRCIHRPKNINYELYKTIMPNTMSPLHVLPFNQALFSIRTYLKALGTSRSDLLSTFATDGCSEEVLDPARVAEVLGLSYDDYIAIANEAESEKAVPQAVSKRKEAWKYWGYEDREHLLNPTNGAIIVEQLLHRSGLTFQELVRLKSSAYVNNLWNIEGGIKGKIRFEAGVDQLCQLDRLQQFLRLRARLGWPINELDAILTTLWKRRNTSTELIIDSKMLWELSAVQELAALANHQPRELQPLWGDIWTRGENSLYQVLFLTGSHLPPEEQKAFRSTSEGTSAKKMENHLPTLLSLLGLKPHEFESIKKETNLCDNLTLRNISVLYRRSLLCSILGVSPAQYHELPSLYKHVNAPFASPQNTLALVRQYLSDSHPVTGRWSLDEILFVTGTKSNSTDPKLNPTLDKVLALVISLRSAMEAARKSFKYPDPRSPVAFESCLIQVFDASDGPKVAKWALTTKDGSTDNASLLSNRSKEVLTTIGSKLVNEPDETARRSIFLDAIRPQITAVLEKQALPSTIVTTLRASFPQIDIAMLSFLLDNVVKIKNKAGLEVSGMDAFLDLFQVQGACQEPGQEIGEEIKYETKFDGYFVPSSTGAYVITSTTQHPVFVDGRELNWTGTERQWTTETKQLAGGHGSMVTFAGNITELHLARKDNDKLLTSEAGVFISRGHVEDARGVLASMLQKYLLVTRLHLSLAEVTEIHQQQTFRPDPIEDTSLPGLRLLEKYCLLRDEFAHAGAEAPLLGLYKWLKSGPINDRDTLLSEVSKEISKVTNWSENLCLSILGAKFRSNHDAASIVKSLKDVSTLFEIRQCVRFTRHLGLPGISVDTLYDLACPEWPPKVQTTFRHAQILRKALEAKYLPTANGESDLLSTANDTIRGAQRTSLIRALLNQKYCVDNELTTTDRLFDHFLIDFQMGPVLQTSRIKQAISTVQVFAQRCINGNEGLSEEVRIKLRQDDDHDYMFRYRLWEASKKAGLFPEQYIDPTLRDDKSYQFRAAEAAMMQSKLDEESIERIIRDYIHQAEEVLDLQLEAYLWDKEHKGFHLFGRTRKSPPVFYYRRADMTLSKDKTRYIPSWSPWAKFPVEVLVLETDADGEKLPHPGSYIIPVIHHNRLLVFIPQITLRQTKIPSPPEDKTLEDYRHEKPLRADNYHEWDIRLGYSELQNGKWSPKTVSQASIHLPISKHDSRLLNEAQDMSRLATNTLRHQDYNRPAESKYANIAHLKFWPRLDKGENTPAKLVMAVEWIHAMSPEENRTTHSLKVKPIADYVLIGHKLMLREPADVGTLPTTLTEFGKVYTKTSEGYSGFLETLLAHKNEWNNPTLTFPIHIKPDLTTAREEKVEWIMSLDDINHPTPTVLACEIHDGNETIQYIGMPPKEDQMKGSVPKLQRVMNEMLPGVIRDMSNAEGLEPIYRCIQGLSLRDHAETFGRDENSKHSEMATPLAIYSWELGVHLPSLLMERLLATHQLELALKVARLMYDHSRTSEGDLAGAHWTFPPFQDDTTLKRVDITVPPSANIHASARANPVAYVKRIALKYIEILVGLGDQHFRQSTLESIPLALERYIEASEAFSALSASIKGQQPSEAHVTTGTLTYGEIEEQRKPQSGQHQAEELEGLGFYRTKDTFRDSMHNLVEDRLYKIRNGLDINGRRQRLPLFAPPMDPGALAQAKAAPGGIAGILSSLESPMPNYRFEYLIRHAFELASELRSLEQQFLTIREKKDAEGLTLLRSRHQCTVLALIKKVKEHEKQEALKAIDVISAARTQQEKAMEYYLQLTADKDKTQIPTVGESWKGVPQEIHTIKGDIPMSSFEKEELDKADTASNLYLAAGVTSAVGAVMAAIPNFGAKVQPMGAGVDTTTGGSSFSRVSYFQMDALKIAAQRMQEEAAQAGRKGALSRALQERRQATNNLGWELVRLDKERSHLQARCDMCDAAIKSSQQEIENAAAEEDWLRTKYTGEQLYNRLDSAVTMLSRQTYQLALEMANVAQRALHFEHSLRFPNTMNPDSQPTKGLTDYWEQSPDGQLAGEALYLDLKRMEMLHMENRTHDFEITKNISIRQLDPCALLQLREQGTADFDLPEVLFDMDFPGHYCRRIVSVAVSIPCILGAYTSLNCTLRLLSHRYRIAPAGSQSAFYNQERSENKFHSDSIPIDAVAVSNGLHDTGTFTLDFNGQPRYGPFEGAGAISKWRLEFPSPFRQFDYHTITDVIIHLRYTAVDGGGQFARTAAGAVKQWITEGKGSALAIDLKNEYPSQWRCLAREGKMDLPGMRDRLPFWTRGQSLSVCSLKLLVFPKPESVPPSVEVKVGEDKITVTENEKFLKDYGHFEGEDISTAFAPSWSINGFKNNSFTQGWLLVQFSSENTSS
ncbi:hypothetical protein RU639_009682 [Aspergillus parasiticus]